MAKVYLFFKKKTAISKIKLLNLLCKSEDENLGIHWSETHSWFELWCYVAAVLYIFQSETQANPKGAVSFLIWGVVVQ